MVQVTHSSLRQPRWLVPLLLIAGLTLAPASSACTLNFTSPPDGATLTNPGTTITGTGSGSANPQDLGSVTATINGTTFFSQSGTFTALINFLGSGAASVTLAEGANQLDVQGSVAGDSCSDHMVLFYEPVLDAPHKQDGPPEECIGNPCDPATGNKYQAETDYAARAGIPGFVRRYNSNAADVDMGLGFGWSGPTLQRLATDGSVMLVRQRSGRSETFNKIGGVWQGDPDTDLIITEDATGFTVTHPAGGIDHYNPQGLLLSTAGPAGLTTTYRYDGGQVTAITGPFGHTLGFGYNALGRLNRLTDPAGLDTTYAYDASGNLVTVTYPDGSTRRYHYEDSAHPHHLTGITDENGDRFATFGFDASGLATLTEHADTGNGGPQESFTLAYPTANETLVTDAAGFVEVLTYAENLGVRTLQSRIHQSDHKGLLRSYDTNNNLLSETDAEGSVTTFDYNATNQLIRRTEAAGTADQRVTELTYLSPDLDLVTTETRPSIRPGQVMRVQTAYNAQLRPISITETGFAPDGATVTRTTRFDYNALGQLIEIDGPRTDVPDLTTLRYHDCNTGNECGQLASVTNAAGHLTTFDSYDPHGRPTQVTDPNGLVTTFRYDPRGRLIQRTDTPPPDQNGIQGSPRITTFGYDPAGQRLLTTQPDGSTQAQTFDAAHDQRSREDAVGNLIKYHYDRRGNRISETTFAPDDSLRRTLDLGYDPRNRPTTTDRGGFVTTAVLDALGNRLTSTDPNGHTTRYSYDALHRLTRVTDPLGGVTVYTYDIADRLASVTDANGNTTTYRYDDLGNPREQHSPDTGLSEAVFDAAGNRISATDARGITRTYRYDALNRLIAIDTPNPAEAIRYSYDQGSHGLGRLTGITDQSGSAQFEYDIFGNRLRDARTLDGQTYVTGYAYDAADRLVQITYPSGAIIDYHRDAAGRITGVDLAQDGTTQPLASTIDYQPFGPLTALTFGNGLQQTRQHDLAYRLTQIDTPALHTRNLARDQNGNITAITDAANPASNQFFNYDPLDRLTQADGPYGHREYAYDPIGNRITRRANGETDTYTIAPDSNRLQTITGPNSTAYDYDAAGNTTANGGQTLAYNGHGRLETVFNQGGPTADYRYNAQGERSLIITPDGTQRIVYGTDGKRLAQTHPDGTIDQELIYLGDMPLAVRVADIPAGFGPADPAIEFRRKRVKFNRRTRTLWNTVALTNTGTHTVTGPVRAAVTNSNATPTNPAGHTDQGEPYYLLLNDGETLLPGTTTPPDRLIQFLPDGGRGLDYQVRLEQPTNATPAQTLFVHADHIDTPTELTDDAQAVVWQASRSPFGSTDLLIEGLPFDMRFPGQFFDAASGLYYNYFRSYNVAAGRYSTSDPIGLLGGINSYVYTGNNPIAFYDFLGLSPEDVQKIRDTINDSVDKMTRDGLRMDSFNNYCRAYPWLPGCDNPNKLKDCGEQTEYVNEQLSELMLDDNWRFVLNAGIGHAWGMAISSNPDDPIIHYDPHSNNLSEQTPCRTCKPWFGDPVFTKENPPMRPNPPQ